jgi:hypothetical protein
MVILILKELAAFEYNNDIIILNTWILLNKIIIKHCFNANNFNHKGKLFHLPKGLNIYTYIKYSILLLYGIVKSKRISNSENI